MLDEWIALESIQLDLPHLYPEAIKLVSKVEKRPDGLPPERINRATCDLAAIRSNQRLINDISVKVDGYDADMRDDLLLWLEQIEVTGDLLTGRVESGLKEGLGREAGRP